MVLKTFKPYTKSTRGTVIVAKKNLWKGKSIKTLTIGQKSSSGRNNLGRITSRRKGSGHKHKYRKIDFYRNKHDVESEVERIEYDPNRTCYIMLLKYSDGKKLNLDGLSIYYNDWWFNLRPSNTEPLLRLNLELQELLLEFRILNFFISRLFDCNLFYLCHY